MRGRFITLEGGEGAGKSTHMRLLADWLGAHQVAVVSTREPGGSAGAEEIRRLLVTGEPERWSPLTETLLLSAARRDHLERLIRPALAAGAWVLCDRFADSTLAYQGHGRGVDPAALTSLAAVVLEGLAPDLTLILDLPPEVGLARTRERAQESARHRGEDRFERMDLEFHRRLRAGFLAIAAAEPDRCRVIDAEPPVAVVQATLQAAVAARFGLPVDHPP